MVTRRKQLHGQGRRAVLAREEARKAGPDAATVKPEPEPKPEPVPEPDPEPEPSPLPGFFGRDGHDG